MTQNEKWRTSPLYTISETARLAKVAPNTIRRWIFGTESAKPVFDDSSYDVARDSTIVSFIQLVEIVVASNFRKEGRVSLEVVRRAYINAKDHFDTEYPFASLKLEPLAGHIIVRLREAKTIQGIPAIDSPGLTTIPGFTIEVLKDIDYESDLAARWWPAGKDKPIVIDPRFSAGLPTVPKRRVTIQNIHNRWMDGQDIEFISRDLVLASHTVEEILRYSVEIAA